MTPPSSTVIEFKTTQGNVPNTAEGWCARLHADDVTEKDRAAFQEWINASLANQAEYELCALTVALARGLAQTPDLPEFVPPRITRKTGDSWWRGGKKLGTYAVAATLLCAVALAAWSWTRSTYATGVGEQKLIALADGSTVQLNTASAIKIEYEQNERQVTLGHGEAFFNVAHDPTRPFVVKAGPVKILVMGTKFNVRADGGEASIAVLEGHVKVDGLDLLPGENARVSSTEPVAKSVNINIARLTAWREGKIYFDQEPLSKVLQEVNRYTDTPFVLAGSTAGRLRLSGVFRTGDTDSVAFALRETYGLKIEHRKGRIQVD